MTRPVEEIAMVRALRVIDALPPGFKPDDSVPLREALPGIWPTIGDLREAVALLTARPSRATGRNVRSPRRTDRG